MKKQATTFDKLNQETAKIEWRELERFFAQGRLLAISESKDLVKTATTIADNATKDVSQLIENKDIFFVDLEWVKENCESTTLLWAVVVAPYVIVQLAE